MLCTNCLTEGRPKNYIKGNVVLELLLWTLFLVPGLIYTVWRLSTRYKGCPKCGAADMIPINSPRAQAMLAGQDTAAMASQGAKG